MKRKLLFQSVLCLQVLAAALVARGDVSLPTIFSDHAVMLKSERTPIWGRGLPGETVSITLDKATAQAQAGPDGAWEAFLDLHAEGPGPFVLKVEGRNRLTISDVVLGEVWLCAGQSNMALSLAATAGANAEVADSTNPWLREFAIKQKASLDPLDTCEGRWVVAGPATSGAFTGVGYYFGKKLQHDLQAPVGLIHSSWGGSSIEAWMSSQAMDGDPDLKATKDKICQTMRDYPEQMKRYVELYHTGVTHREGGFFVG